MDESTAKVSFLELNQAIWGESSDAAFPERFITRLMANFRILGFETPGAFITTAFPYLLSLGGLVLFVMLIWGSMEIFFAAGSAKLAEQGKKRITTALIGFFIIFSAFWIGQIITTIFGLDIGLSTSSSQNTEVYTCGGQTKGTCPKGQDCKYIQVSLGTQGYYYCQQ